MARLPGLAQRVVAFDVGLRFGGGRQSIRRLHGWWVDRLAVDQSVQHVQNMRLRRHASLQCEFDGSEHGLLVMLEDESQNLDHLAVTARRLKHALLQSSEGRRQFDEGGAIAQGSGLALNDRQIVPPIENGRRTLSLVRAGEDSAVFADDLPFGDDDDTLGIDPHADRAIGKGGRHAIAIALQMEQARRRDALGVLDEAVERPGKLHQVLRFLRPGVGHRVSLRALRRVSPQLSARVSSQSFSAASVGKFGVGCQSRWRASWTFFSICPFSQPEAGLQNSASNRKWLTIAANRALTWRFLPRPTLSTAVRMLS